MVGNKARREHGLVPHSQYCRVGVAEELPFPDASVDLLTAASAAHWFNPEKFLTEVKRTLKPHGCIALLGYVDMLKLSYGHCEDRLTGIYKEVQSFLLPYVNTKVAAANSKLQHLFDAIPFPDKKRVESIPVKTHISVSEVVGFIETFSYYQAYRRVEPEAGPALLQNMQTRFLEAMGVSSSDTKIEITLNYFCVLACKPL
ncbi:putative methyltransferase DDB-G0268948 [Arapaima gigas]